MGRLVMVDQWSSAKKIVGYTLYTSSTSAEIESELFLKKPITASEQFLSGSPRFS